MIQSVEKPLMRSAMGKNCIEAASGKNSIKSDGKDRMVVSLVRNLYSS